MPSNPKAPTHPNGFTAIANQLLEALARISLTDYESRCLFFLLRKTYGWKKKRDAIGYGQWAKGIGVSRRSVISTLSNLVNRKIVEKDTIVQAGRNSINFWKLQEDFSQWNGYQPQQLELLGTMGEGQVVSQNTPVPIQPVSQNTPVPIQPVSQNTPVPVQVVSPGAKVVSPGTLEVVSPGTPTKEKKETIQKKKQAQGPGGTPAAFSAATKQVFEELKKRRGYNSPHAGAEAQAITWMLKQGYSVEQIMTAHDNLKDQPFWDEKFLNMQSVKAQIGEITAAGHEGKKKHGKYKGSPGNEPGGAFDDLA